MYDMRFFSIVFLSLLVFCSCDKTEVFTDVVNSISENDFQQEVNGLEVGLYTLEGENGIGIKVTNFGARIVAICVPDKTGIPIDVVAGYKTLNEYLNNKDVYIGCAVGRFGNRIANGTFSLDGNDYRLVVNNGSNAIHGGPTGFHRRIWEVVEATKNRIVFKYLSVDGEEGYPGNLEVNMTYELTDDNALKIEYLATTDKTTIVNLTNHSYFNLSGEGESTIIDHVLKMNVDYITPLDSNSIPLGDMMDVKSTAFDFNRATSIASQLDKGHEQLTLGNGFDHNFVIRPESELNTAAVIYSPLSGVQMEVVTDQPGVQFYTANFMNGSLVGKSGLAYKKRGLFCFETQHYPDSPNQLQFPTTVLKPDEQYKHVCIYKFSVKK